MTNKQIATAFNKLGKIMELHGENPFKIRSYTNAYITLRKLEEPLDSMPLEEISQIKGVGKAIAEKIQELISKQQLNTYKKYTDITPPGIVEMLDIKGFGPKKIKTIWKELEIETIGELLYACNENRLVELKGFGFKTQETLKGQLEYFISSQGKYHYASLVDEALELEETCQAMFPNEDTNLCGAVRRKMQEVEAIELITTISPNKMEADIEGLEKEDNGYIYKGYPCFVYQVDKANFGSELFKRSASEDFISLCGNLDRKNSELEVFESLELQYTIPEYRESSIAYDQAKSNQLPDFITEKDLKGVIHNHTTYSDGLHTLKEMADYTQSAGYEYLVISDHSKAAFYANGLKEDRCLEQMAEIDELNNSYKDFKVFKSIECDILNDGSLDYDNDFLREFDLVIASVHSNLRMDESKANQRIVKAIEHPSTHILGHPTGRLLLSREGYPINHELIIDACISNGVIIELNANPQRLDIDWTWIPYILERGGMISINPDAHNKHHIHFMKYGIAVARKAGLSKENCLNALPLEGFQSWVDGLPS